MYTTTTTTTTTSITTITLVVVVILLLLLFDEKHIFYKNHIQSKIFEASYRNKKCNYSITKYIYII